MCVAVVMACSFQEEEEEEEVVGRLWLLYLCLGDHYENKNTVLQGTSNYETEHAIINITQYQCMCNILWMSSQVLVRGQILLYT